MVFNGDSNDQDLCSLADELGGSNDVSFPLKKKALYANWAMRKIWAVIWKAYGGWIADDSNNSGAPEAITNLVTTARNLYAFATAQSIYAMEWLDENGQWFPLTKITLEEIKERGIAETEFENTAGRPMYYRPVQNGVRIYPDSDTARNNALKAHISRDISSFTAASTNVSPGFDSACHEAVAIFMAYRYCKKNAPAKAPGLAQDWAEALVEIRDHYAAKFRENFPAPIRPTRQDYVGQFL